MTEKVKQKIKSSLEPTIEEIKQEIQTNITELCKSENLLMKASKDLSIKMMRSKGLVEIQKKLYDRLLDLAVQQTTGLKHTPLIISAEKNPRKTLKKLPLMPKELEQYERILAGSKELEKLDDRFTDYLIYFEQIKKCRLELHRLNDCVNYSEFKYVGPGGVLHRKPSANAKADTRYYKKVKSVRVSSPRTVGIRKHNNSKRVRHVELLGKSSSREHKKRETKIVPETERIQLKMTSPCLECVRQHVYDLQDEYWSAQQKIMPLTRELKLQNNKPEQVKRCNQISKTLCDLIDDATWKQKLYERENAKLQKMLERRSYTRIERAFGAESSQGNVTDISNSYDQGPSEKSTVKLTTKEKLWQLHDMLSELENEVHPDSTSNVPSWEGHSDSDDDKKPAATITSAQAKLAKELIKLANTYKVPKLTFTDKAIRRSSIYQTWFTKLRPILAMFTETASFIQGKK
jgi:hypothetical protein